MSRAISNVALLELWLDKGAEILDSKNYSDLGGYIRVWIGTSKDIVQLSTTCRSYMLFLTPRCDICQVTWSFRGFFCDAWWLPVARTRCARANVCERCDKDHPLWKNPNAGRYEFREFAQWSTSCSKCGGRFHDKWVHDMYACPLAPQPESGDDSSASDSSGDGWLWPREQ